jgi:hypothetical protein
VSVGLQVPSYCWPEGTPGIGPYQPQARRPALSLRGRGKGLPNVYEIKPLVTFGEEIIPAVAGL